MMKIINHKKNILREAGVLLITAFLVLSTSTGLAGQTSEQKPLLSVANNLQSQINGGKTAFDEEWIHYDDGTNVNAIGLTEGGSFEWGIRLTPTELADYDGEELTTVRHYHGMAGSSSFTTSGDVKIYDAGTSSSPGALITSEPYTVTDVDWFDVVLSNPVTIDASKDLWVCVSTTHAAGEYPAGVGPGPVVPGKGGWITVDGTTWEQLGIDITSLDYNWNLWAGIGGAGGEETELEIVDISGGLGVSATVKNVGENEAIDVEIELQVTGGLLGRINITIPATQSSLAVDAEEIVSSGMFFGLGPIEITVTADAANADAVSKNATGFVIGPFVIGVK